jgi:prolyl oligopeptidase
LKPDGYYYFHFNSGLQAQSIIYRVKKGQEEDALKRATDPKQPAGELFLDPNLFSIDGTTALSFSATSESGIYMAYGVSRSGSDCQTIYVRRTDCPHTKSAADGGKRGEDPGRMEDTVEKVKFSSLSWMKDDSGQSK